MPKPTYEEMYDVLNCVLNDLHGWAEASTEGFTEEENERIVEYHEFLERLEAALVPDEDELPLKVERFLSL